MDGVLILPGRLLVDATVLGARLTSRIGEVSVALTFPVVVPDDVNDPAARLGVPHYEAGTILPPTRPGLWGFVTSSRKYVVKALQVAFLAAVPSSGDVMDAPEANSVALGVPGWFDTVNAWVCAWLSEPPRVWWRLLTCEDGANG